ncbi:O-acyltransferase WSD1-like [Oryza brachyantha]|nr:O-acyltransferase WSD1-like [Oryza brachyantha]
MMDRLGLGGIRLRKPVLLSIDNTAPAPAGEETVEKAGEEEPVSPAGRLFREPHFSCYVVCSFGVAEPVDLPAVRAGIEATLARHPRFCSIQVLDELEKGAKPKWVRTKVNLDDHIIVPDLGPTDTSADPEKAVEDYVSSLSTASMAMDHSRPLWELHVLDFPTAEAAATVALRVHHSLGDGVSLLSLLIACTRRADDPGALPALPSAGRRARDGPLYALPRPPLAAGALALAAWAFSYLLLVWHTVVDVVCFALTAASLTGDARTVLKGEEGAEFRPRRFVNRTLSLDDVKAVKNAMGCTVNDVLVGVSSAALSRYYFRRTGESEGKSIKVRTALMVNLRPTPGLHELAKMMESGKNNGVKWGNQFGYMILPFHLAKHDDPLEYVRKATKVTRRKKSSMEAIFTYWSADMVVKIFGIKAAASLCYGMFSNTTLSFSNLAGPREQIVFCGNPIVYISPTSYGHQHALTLHWQSYMNIVKLALAVDETQFPDAHELLDDFTESLRLIRYAASREAEKTQDGS